MKIAVIGKGAVGKAVAPRLRDAGHEVTYGVRDPGGAGVGDGVPIAGVGEAIAAADVVVLAVHWDAVDNVLAHAGPLAGKVLVDCTNPFDFSGPELRPLIAPDRSAAELIAAKTEARVVKALNQVGATVMANASGYRARPVQFAASDDADAKRSVLELLTQIGFDARDAGPLSAARELEGMARLWTRQAFTGMSSDTAWALVGA